MLDKYIAVHGAVDKSALMEIDRKFHARIGEIAGSALLVEFLHPIHKCMSMSRIWFLPHWQLQDFNMTEGEHERLYEALRTRNASEASAAMADHISSLRRRITRASG